MSALALAQRCRLHELAAEHVRPPGSPGAPGAKVVEHGHGHRRRRRLRRRRGLVAARRDVLGVHRCPCLIDARDAPAVLHLRSLPPVPRPRRGIPAAFGGGDSAAAGGGRGRPPQAWTTRTADLPIRPGRGRTRLFRSERTGSPSRTAIAVAARRAGRAPPPPPGRISLSPGPSRASVRTPGPRSATRRDLGRS